MLPACAQDCRILNFENESDFQLFEGDFRPTIEDYFDGHQSMRIFDAAPSSSKEVTFAVLEGDCGMVSFRWKKAGEYSKFFNLKFYIDEIDFDCNNNNNWGKEPFYRNIDNNNNSHILKWVLEHNGREYIGSPPTAYALIDELKICSFPPYHREEEIFKNFWVNPTNGSILCPFEFNVEIDNVSINSTISLWTQNSPEADWICQKSEIYNGPSSIIKFTDIYFNSGGQKNYKFKCGNKYSNKSTLEVYPPYVEPPEGILNDTYTYKISRKNILNYSEILLEIRNHNDFRWVEFGKGDWGPDNITFIVPDLSFIQQPYFGDIEFRFKIGDKIIGPFRGPRIYTNIRNVSKNITGGTFSVDVLCERCGQPFYLKYDNHTHKKIYTNCGGWQNFVFEGLNYTNSKLDPLFGDCDG